jgi:hypothetical protein
MDEVTKKQHHDGRKMNVLRLQDLIGEVLSQIEGVNINLSEQKEVVVPWVGLLHQERWNWRDERLGVSGRIRRRSSAGTDGGRERES